MRSASLILLATIGWACSQPLQPVVNPYPPSAPDDFFWSAAALDSSELTYSVDRNGVTATHPIISSDGVNVFDQYVGKMAFRIVSRGDSIAIDNLGANSLFSLPTGYFFAKDSVVAVSRLVYRDTLIDSVRIHLDSSEVTVDTVWQRPGAMTLLERVKMFTNNSWYAGKIAGPGLGSGLEVTGRVLDHVDTLSMPVMQNVPAASYGETFMVRYSHENAKDTLHFPLFWKVYYSRNIGPVLIEEYLDPTASKTGEMSLQSQAVLKPR